MISASEPEYLRSSIVPSAFHDLVEDLGDYRRRGLDGVPVDRVADLVFENIRHAVILGEMAPPGSDPATPRW
jgi:hypothetical protein